MVGRNIEPIFLRPSAHPALWGVENWLISNHASDMSIVEGGSFDGKRLCEVLPDFPLLVKIIRAEQLLSVQVHPGESTCTETGGEPKSEMWCALSDGFVYAGFKPGTLIDDVREALSAGQLEKLLFRHEVKFGDVLYVPAGMVHSIGGGTVLYEVQQSTDTTFRLYDWNRVAADGKTRQLHIEKAFKALDCSLPPPVIGKSATTPYFDFSQLHLTGETEISSANSYLVIYVASGKIVFNGRVLGSGENFLLLPNTSAVLRGDGAILLRTAIKAL